MASHHWCSTLGLVLIKPHSRNSKVLLTSVTANVDVARFCSCE